ncbi:TolC family outer membrane protein [Kangiella koreensis]|uniref:Type I secretion outer membrane protein, TolC family n=1 Tax=Kangiella koreensis (strain DSM 16069 / JCM 12317 / KCTC 12182 / SW-125) TaxID=523791 RepID=C7R6J5_KANKD|nr:TolC family outer membrane protein [Kangiella koreensis]ACV27423.1 type I secretion outer membrane protein, TolC family [Kangiella koreensis DSM 16069]
MKPKAKIKLVTLAILSLSGLTANANTDLLDVYQDALKNDPQYKISDANLRATEQGVRINRSSLLPQVSASATKGRSDYDYSGQGLDGSPSDPFNNSVDSTTYRVQLNQSLFDWNLWVALEQAEMRVRVAELNHAANLQDLMLRTAQAYFRLLSTEEVLAATRSEKEALQSQLDMTREQFESGLSTATDYLDAQANFDQAQISELQSENEYYNAKENLREITGQYYAELEATGNSIKLTPPTPENIDDWMRAAREANLNLKAKQFEVRVAREEVKRNRSGHYPTADLSVSYSDQETETDRFFPVQNIGQNTLNMQDGYQAGITVTIPLFSGLRTSAQTEQAKQNYLRTTHELDQSDRLVQKNARMAYTNLQTAIKSFEANKRAYQSSSSSLESTQEGYQAGTRNIVDVLIATRSTYSSQRNMIRAKYDYLISSLQLKAAAGTLTENDLEIVNNWLEQY